MITDCHYHYFKEEFCVQDKLGKMDACGIERIALIAAICPPFKSEPNALAMRFMRAITGKKLFLPLLKKLLCTFKEDGIDILGEHVPIYFLPDNASVFAAANKCPEHLMAYVTVNPDRQSANEMDAEMAKYAGACCFCGIKVHPFYHQYSAEKLDSVFRLAQKYDKPILIHMGFGDLAYIHKLADGYIGINIILAHCAFPYFDLAWAELKKRKNVFVDISSGCYVDAEMAKRAVSVLGAEHVLYGSDGPYGTKTDDGSFDMRAEYEFVTAEIHGSELRQVRSANFEQLISRQAKTELLKT